MSADFHVIYTDGACSGNPGPGGWAAVILSTQQQVRELGGGALATTNNRMEMTGVLRGLEAMADSSVKIQVFTDSVYVIRGISQWVFGWQRRGWKTADGSDVVNRDLWQLLMAVVQRVGRERIQWNFIRGHKGVAGNERCDEIAVGFSKGQPPRLYIGPLSGYGYDIDELPTPEALPDYKDRGAAPKKAFSYLSVVGGVLERHTTWAECEARVKGRSGAKFKKAMSAEDESRIRAEWGF